MSDSVDLEKMSSELGVSVEMLEMFSAQAPLWGSSMTLFFAGMLWAILYFWKKLCEKDRSPLALGIILWGLVFLWFLLVNFYITEIVTAFINPEYWAVAKFLMDVNNF